MCGGFSPAGGGLRGWTFSADVETDQQLSPASGGSRGWKHAD